MLLAPIVLKVPDEPVLKVNYRFCSLVEKGAHYLARRNLVGGVEIRQIDPDSADTFDRGDFYACVHAVLN